MCLCLCVRMCLCVRWCPRVRTYVCVCVCVCMSECICVSVLRHGSPVCQASRQGVIDQANKRGMTALMLAASVGNSPALEALLHNGAGALRVRLAILVARNPMYLQTARDPRRTYVSPNSSVPQYARMRISDLLRVHGGALVFERSWVCVPAC